LGCWPEGLHDHAAYFGFMLVLHLVDMVDG
jgi:hypothetical protein